MESRAHTVDQWTRPRKCISCGRQFSLEDHGSSAAKTAAQHLDDGTLDPAALPAFISKCPPCFAGNASPQTNSASNQPPTISAAREQEAVAAAMAIGNQVLEDDNQQVYYYAKRIGAFVSVLSIFGVVIIAGYMQLNRDEFNAIPWFVLTALVGLLGIATATWAHRRSK